MEQEDFENFGIPAENIRAAEKWANKQRKKYRYHTDVPSRKQVRKLPPGELTQLLVGWMVHSPIEIIPSRSQIELVVEVICQRDDVGSLQDILKMCRNYVDGH